LFDQIAFARFIHLFIFRYDVTTYNLFEVTISPKKLFLQREKEHCAIFIRAHFMWGLRLELGLSWGVRVRVGVRIR